ncbi:MAG TPA: S46 family peptidase [Phycisphaerales bacterium]|nr:S46 family peptidase [Phycisphaerales bacterium]
MRSTWMKACTAVRIAAGIAVVAFGTVAARADEGMWLLTSPPREYLRSTYGFEPSAEWLEHVQKSAVRFSTGGSGSLISSDGLVMTNHHVGSDMLAKLSTKERDLLVTGFLAGSREEELPCPDLELNILWTIEDVTDAVNAGISADLPAAKANDMRQKAIAEISKSAMDKTGMHAEVVTLYQGGKYHLYCYKRYTDVRLVMAPEQSIAFFGGDTDNFEYPRFNLDCTFFRIYENGKPLKSEHFLKWSEGSKEGELAVVAGHPGRTNRLNTVDHLRFMRDVELPMRLDQLWRLEVKYQNFNGRSAENERIGKDDLFGIANSRKALTGQLAGLLDPANMEKKASAEKALREFVSANPDRRAKWGDAWDTIARAQEARKSWALRHRILNAGLSSHLFQNARNIVRAVVELQKPNAERLREYRDSQLQSLYTGLYSPAPIYDALEIFTTEASLSYMAEKLGSDDPIVRLALDGKSPRARAEDLVLQSTLKDPAARRKLLESGKDAVFGSKDPMIQLAIALDPEARAIRKKYEDEVEAVERASYAKIAAAKFAMEGEKTYPDATFTLRLSFGPIAGYMEEGKFVPPYTNFGGLYERARDRAGMYGFDLPQSWIDAKDTLDLSTPFNFVCSADIIGGNSGSPVINVKGEVIGLIFDGNIQSLPGAFIYDGTANRAVSVDSRAIITALRDVYGAKGLVKEITGK